MELNLTLRHGTTRNFTKLCHMFGSEPALEMVDQNLVVSRPNVWYEFHAMTFEDSVREKKEPE